MEAAAEAEESSFHAFIDALPEHQPPQPAPAPRIPAEVDGIQINFCKTPGCANFGIPDDPKVAKWAKGAGNPARYALVGAGKAYPHLQCKACSVSFPIKSNKGVAEELARLRDEGTPSDGACCPNEACENHGNPVSLGKLFYSAFGKTAIGSLRWKCKACGKTFSEAQSSTTRQRDSHKNKTIFTLLVNKMPMRRICEAVDIGPKALYGKIDFIYRQCLAYAAERERQLAELPIKRLYIGVDRQDYAVNWTQRNDRRNIVLSAVASVDNGTGYCFGLHLNFDPALDPFVVENASLRAGDAGKPAAYRRHAREWLEQDYADSVARSAKKASAGSVEQKVANAYAQASRRLDVESPDVPTRDERLPDSGGMQIHSEYTLYGHFLRLKELFKSAEKVRFFLDQDSGMRAACLAAFAEEIKTKRTADAFYVSIAKDMTVDMKRRKKREALVALSEFMEQNPGLSKSEAVLAMIKAGIASMPAIGKWNDRWLRHPFPDMSEPEKAISYLTDMGDYDPDHLAWLYNKASLHAVDSLFMKIRRRLASLERPLHSQSNTGRVWSGYAPYNPRQVVKLLTIFRVFHNFIQVGEDKMTPAMRLGLAKGPVRYEDVLYHV